LWVGPLNKKKTHTQIVACLHCTGSTCQSHYIGTNQTDKVIWALAWGY